MLTMWSEDIEESSNFGMEESSKNFGLEESSDQRHRGVVKQAIHNDTSNRRRAIDDNISAPPEVARSQHDKNTLLIYPRDSIP